MLWEKPHMLRSIVSAAAVATLCVVPPLGAASAATIITHAKVLQGGITPGDDPGYPATLSLPGSYVLGGNLPVPPNQIGIDVTNHEVSIDGAGYRIHGGGPASGGSIAIRTNFNSLTVANTTIVWFRNGGIRTNNGDFLTVENVRLIFNGGADGVIFAIQTRYFAQIRNSTIALNESGIFCADSCMVQNNLISQNGGGIAEGDGIECGRFCHVEGNQVANNRGYGILIRSGSVLGNTIMANTYHGVANVVGASDVGFGNNTIIENYPSGGGQQIAGGLLRLQPNVCRPVAC
jgi:hypothetical protein